MVGYLGIEFFIVVWNDNRDLECVNGSCRLVDIKDNNLRVYKVFS